jgi:hypothetical protein
MSFSGSAGRFGQSNNRPSAAASGESISTSSSLSDQSNCGATAARMVAGQPSSARSKTRWRSLRLTAVSGTPPPVKPPAERPAEAGALGCRRKIEVTADERARRIDGLSARRWLFVGLDAVHLQQRVVASQLAAQGGRRAAE